MNNRTVIYARFSSHSQTEQSIEGQLRECYDYAKRNNLVVLGEYIDRALTGTTDKRPSFLRMIDDSKKKTFDYVLVYQLDRFARNRYDSANYKAKLKKNNVRVISARENITDDASGVLMEGILESMAEYYSAELSQKVKRGIRESFEKGHVTGGAVTYGYKVVNKKMVIDPTEADVVREIFERYRLGAKAYQVADWLTANGIFTRTGRQFDRNIVAKIIRNKRYKGIVEHDGKIYTNISPAIVSNRVWDDCNHIMDHQMYRHQRCGKHRPYVLSGRLFCGYCGARITAEGGTGRLGQQYYYYKCYTKRKEKDGCIKKNVKKEWLEDLVFDKTIEYISQPHVLDQIARIVTDQFNKSIEKSNYMTSLENDLADVEKSLDSFMNAISSGILTPTTKDRVLALERKKDELGFKIEMEKKNVPQPITVDKVRAFLECFAKKDYTSDAAVNEFFLSFIYRVVLYEDYIYIFYNTSPEFPVKIMLDKNELEALQALRENGVKYAENKESIQFEPFWFKLDALGGEAGI